MKNSVTAVDMKALAEKNFGELCYIIFPGLVVQKSNFLLSFCFISRFVGEETEVKEPQNVTNDTV